MTTVSLAQSAGLQQSFWKDMQYMLELEAVVVAVAWCASSLFHALVLSCIYLLVNKKQFYRKMHYYSLYEESKAYCTEFKASLHYIVTREKRSGSGSG